METVVVVGASSGVGFEVASKFCKNGYRVLALARRESSLHRLAAMHSNVIPFSFDVTDFNTIKHFLKTAVVEYGKIQGVVYCAGVQHISPLKMVKPEHAENLMKVNFLGAYFFLKEFSSKLICSFDNSFFIVISSIAAEKPEAGILAYSASKAALENLVKGAPKEVSPIRVNAISPGFMVTEMTQSNPKVYTSDFISTLDDSYPLGIPSIEDVVGAVEFLASESAKKITGQILKVDGGGSLL